MKTLKHLILGFVLLLTYTATAQQGINYKAIIKDDSGNVMANTAMNIQFTIHESTATGTIVYQESHNFTTDANGLVILTIGTSALISVGTFSTIDWAADLHFLQTTISYSGGVIDFDATQFMAVPYAKHAEIAENVFSGDYNDLTNQPAIPRGLEQIRENGNTGWRLIGRNTANYGNIEENAVDLSFSDFSSSTRGATGESSIAMGIVTTASGFSSTAMGNETSATGSTSTAMGRYTEASGNNATAMGTFTTAKSYAETAIGIFSTDYTPMSPNFWYGNDRIFNIGNGFSNSNRSDALTVLKNGTITAPSVTNSLINTAGDKALITKEYADTNYLVTSGSVDISIDGGELQQTSTGTANLIPLAYGIVESTGSVLSGTGNFTAFLSGNVFIIDVNGTESLSYSNTVAIITPISTTARTSTTILSDGNGDSDLDLNVRIFTASGTQVTTTFQFVIHKL